MATNISMWFRVSLLLRSGRAVLSGWWRGSREIEWRLSRSWISSRKCRIWVHCCQYCSNIHTRPFLRVHSNKMSCVCCWSENEANTSLSKTTFFQLSPTGPHFGKKERLFKSYKNGGIILSGYVKKEIRGLLAWTLIFRTRVGRSRSSLSIRISCRDLTCVKHA